MRRRWLRPGAALHVACAMLCGALAAGPAMAEPTRLAQGHDDADDEDDTPVPPPPPPVTAPQPAPSRAWASTAPPGPATPPAPGPPPPGFAGPGSYGPGTAVPHGYGYGDRYGYGPPPNPYAVSPSELYSRGGSLRNIGMPLTIAGMVLLAVGIGLVAKGVESTDLCYDGTAGTTSWCGHGGTYIAWGAVALVGSALGLGIGIPLWVIGASRQSRALKMGFQPALAQPFLAPTRNGAVAGMRLLTF